MTVAEREREGCWVGDHWLRHCEGFRIDDVHGHVGYVEEVLVDRKDMPTALRITGRAQVVPVSSIEELDPAHELITLG